jgi:hypothetical protein
VAQELRLDFRTAISESIHASAMGHADELAIFGPRGEGKTWGAAGTMIVHAEQHHAAGYPLPTRWIGFTDTFESHKNKTLESLSDPLWGGTWELSDGGHVASFRFRGVTLVRLLLFGVDSPRDANKVRTECHGVWCEEPAPAADLSSGISENAWEIALTSRRKASHAHPGLITANYPDEDHWVWRRFVTEPRPGTAYVRIPKGERATAAQREMWASKISDPILRRRLIDGEPGLIILGEQVAVGYADRHTSPTPLRLIENVDLWFSWDSAPNAHTHATLIGQRVGPFVRLFAGLVSERTGLKQHIETRLLPWLEKRAPWALKDGADDRLYHRYDPAMDTGEGGDIDQSPLRRVQEELGGHFRPGAVDWPARIAPVVKLLQEQADGIAALQIDPGPDTELLRKALAGRWHYAKNAAGTVVRDLPMKPNHPWEDLGDALCYLIGGMAPSREIPKPVKRAPLQYTRVLGAIR